MLQLSHHHVKILMYSESIYIYVNALPSLLTPQVNHCFSKKPTAMDHLDHPPHGRFHVRNSLSWQGVFVQRFEVTYLQHSNKGVLTLCSIEKNPKIPTNVVACAHNRNSFVKDLAS